MITSLLSAAALAVAATALAHPAAPTTHAAGATANPPTRGAARATAPKKTSKPAAKTTVAAPAGSGARIAFVDTGVAPVGVLAQRLVDGTDLVDGSGSTTDHNGHGTAMASIAGGICPSCAVVPVRALGDNGSGTSDVAASGVRWAAANGARVINLSLTANGEDPTLTSAIESAIAGGTVVVVAAGNAGSADASNEGYPGASATDALTVAAVDGSRHLEPWSNHGPWVHLAAPGVLQTLGANGSAVTATGTSGSAAYVSGAAGLLLSCDPALTPAQVGALLTSTAHAAPPVGGVVDPQAALAALQRQTGCTA